LAFCTAADLGGLNDFNRDLNAVMIFYVHLVFAVCKIAEVLPY
jgi:hypothetical protein